MRPREVDMNTARIIADFFGCLASVGISCIYCEAVLPGKSWSNLRVWIVRCAAYLLCLAGTFLVASTPVRAVVMTLWITLLTCCYECSVPRRIYTVLVISILGDIAEVVMMVLTVTILGISMDLVMDSVAVYAANVFASKLLYLLFVRFLLFCTRKERTPGDSGYSASLLVVFLFIMFHMGFFLRATLDAYSVRGNILAIISMLLMSAAIVAVFYLGNRQAKLREYWRRLDEMERRYRMQVESYEKLRESAQAANRNVHDVKNFVLAVNSYLEQGRVDEAKEKLDEYAKHLSDLPDTRGD